MSTFKCKMCGGTLEIQPGQTVAECEYCGTQQTVAKSRDEVITNLFTRANNLRMKSEFDRAEQTYEKILEQDNSEAEAHWGVVLCRYGIEYVEDPKTFKRVPTCHRTSYKAVTTDADYLAAIEHADDAQKAIYQAEAKVIDEIQKNILSIVKNEKPFDVFICYKESDENGNRTIDSTIANDIYHQLTQEGFKVFYAAITLEDKLGQEYEPYIFAALNSAKVMLVLGTKPECFTAVWVKNEWSRFLSLMKSDRSRLLIPCYRGMDPYDLPDEFAHLQAQDMGKIGFINDVVRGIKKVFVTDTPKAEPVLVTQVVTESPTTNANTAALLKRAYMFLEDGEWDSANEYCERVLDIDPECAEAYLGKLLSNLKVIKQEALRNQAKPFDSNNNYQKAVRFADEKLKTSLTGYIEYINTRNENARLNGIYTNAKNAMSTANTEITYKEAAELFESIREYQDSATLALSCYEKAEVVRKDSILAEGNAKMHVSMYESAIKLFESISGWKDADEKIYACQKKIEEIDKKAEAQRLERERKAEMERKEAEKRVKRNKKIAIITTPIVCAIIAFVIALDTVIIPNVKYNGAVTLMESGQYEEAIAAFKALDEYKDAAEQIMACENAIMDGKYNDAVVLMESGQYEEAIAAFKALDEYKDSLDMVIECKYLNALALMESGQYEEAFTAFEAMDGYKDSTDKANSIYGKYTAEKLKSAQVGDYIIFGSYEQDNDISNGKEEIEWLVLEKTDNKIFVISKYALDCHPYNTIHTDVTWETCSLRKWLNEDFINAAFNEAERIVIPTVTVSADKNPGYDTDPGNATEDQVFLLSITEVNQYFASDNTRQCEPTDYTVAHGTSSTEGTCWWYLRSPGYNQYDVANVYVDGSVYENGYYAIMRGAVRPALWIDLSAYS